jgi:benzoyl-CoA reductase/2-hydroxyglutaryl-CoA dehydratase subunit BcrC/BadD/HgdB
VGHAPRAEVPSAAESGAAALQALAAHYHGLAYGPRAFIDRADQLLREAREYRVDGVILWLIEQEEALVWDLPAERELLRSHGIPHLALTRSCWDVQRDTLDAIQAFASSLPRSP